VWYNLNLLYRQESTLMASPLTVDITKASPLLVDLRTDEELVETDGVPLDSDWHRLAMSLLLESVKHWLHERTDYYVAGNMFIYYRVGAARRRRFRGPDFFFVKGTSRTPFRRYWVVWQEGGLFPNTIIELLSPSTRKEDLTTKKDIYEKVFRTPDYFCYDPDAQHLLGWRLNKKKRYEPLVPNERGWLWSEELGLWVGTWSGNYQGGEATWLRFYDAESRLVHTASEAEHQRAEAEHRRAEAERQRAETTAVKLDAVAAELARLKALLASKGILPESAEDAGE
jgi:Uma2 family endonuclease